MNRIRKRYKVLLILLSLFAIQTTTYLTIAPGLLKNKLLPDDFATLTHHSDSVYVRDFYVTDCISGPQNIHISHHLDKDEKFIKEKFGVKYVYFDMPEKFTCDDTLEKQFNLVYYTWAVRPTWQSLFWSMFSARQTEILLTDNKYFYKKEVHYHWYFFFWFSTFEWFESGDLVKNSKQKMSHEIY